MTSVIFGELTFGIADKELSAHIIERLQVLAILCGAILVLSIVLNRCVFKALQQLSKHQYRDCSPSIKLNAAGE